MNQSIYLLVPILLPVLGALAVYVLPRRQQRRRIFNALLALQVVYVCLAFGINRSITTSDGVLALGLWPDTLGKLFALLFGVLFWATGWFGFDAMDRLGRTALPCFLIILGMLTGLSYAGTLPTFCLFYVAATLLTFMLLCPGPGKQLLRLIYTMLASLPVCCGCLTLPRYLTSLQFRSGGVLSGAASMLYAAPLLTTALLMLLGFCAAVFLPLSIPQQTNQPPAAQILLAAILPGGGVLGAMRTLYYLFGSRFLHGTGIQTLLLAACLMVMLCASLCACLEKQLFLRLAWGTVVQSSCVLLGLFTLNNTAFLGALLQAIFHTLCSVCLFLCADAMREHTGVLHTDRMRGIGRQMPLELGCFATAGLALVGCPPMCWFSAKQYLYRGLLTRGDLWGSAGAAVLVLCMLLAVYYLLWPCVQGFFPGKDYEPDARVRTGLSVIVPVACLLICLLGVGLLPGTLLRTLRTIAITIL